MQAIVNSLCALAGVRHAAIYKQGELIHSDLTDQQKISLVASSDVIAQIFSATEAIGKSHNEIFIGVDSGYLAGFRLHMGYVALLITEKKINFPMISMGIKSASETIKQLEQQKQNELDRLRLLAVEQKPEVIEVVTDESLLPFFDNYTKLLTSYVGPAASVLVDEAVDAWKQTYTQSRQNLPYLVALLEAELDSPQERHEFSIKAAEATLKVT